MTKIFVSIVSSTVSASEFQSRDLDVDEFQSRDLDLCGREYAHPVSYLVEDNTAKGDSILVVSGLVGGAPSLPYEFLKKEVGDICKERGVSVEFVSVPIDESQPDALTCSEFLLSVSKFVAEGDLLFADLTAPAPFSFALMAALHYISEVRLGVRVVSVVCCHGNLIVDVTSLVLLLSFASREGDKAEGVMNFLV